MHRVILDSESTVRFLVQSELRFLSYRLRHFYKVAVQHFLLRPITPPLSKFFDLKFVFSTPKLGVEYDSSIIYNFSELSEMCIYCF